MNSKKHSRPAVTRTVIGALLAAGIVTTASTASAQIEPCEEPFTMSAVAYDNPALVLGETYPGVGTRIAEVPRSVFNGDFLITAPGRGTSFNAADEAILWAFNLYESNEEMHAYARAPVKPPIEAAWLTLSFVPTHAGVGSDILAVLGVPLAAVPIRPRAFLPTLIAYGTTYTISIDLLRYYRAEDISKLVSLTNAGRIPMLYMDDALVQFAQIDLYFGKCI